MDRLTDNQERFVQELIKCDNQRQAYRAAYPNCKGSDSVVDVKASQLLAMDKVGLRYDELKAEVLKPSVKRAIATKQDILEETSSIAMGTKDAEVVDMFGNKFKRKPTLNEQLKAIELMGKYYDVFSDKKKVEVSGNLNNPYAALTEEELRRLANGDDPERGPDTG